MSVASAHHRRIPVLFGASVIAVAALMVATAALANHPDPDPPLNAAEVDAIFTALGCPDQAIPEDLGTPPDRKVGGSGNTYAGEDRDGDADITTLAIWANADDDEKETTLDISGSENVVNGDMVTRSHLKIAASDSVFMHATEYGTRSVDDKEAFDLSGANNCFNLEPDQVPRNSSLGFPTGAFDPAPFGFPFRSQFDPDNDGNLQEHFGPGSAFATEAGSEYFVCSDTMDTIPAPLLCDSNGNLSGGVQGVAYVTGLYFVTGNVAISPSNLSAQVTIVAVGTVDVSGSTQANFTPFHRQLLFASEFDLANNSANDDTAEDALKVGGSSSTFRGIVVAPSGRTQLSGSVNSWTCPVMGDRVTLNGSLLYVSGEECAGAANVVTEIHADDGQGDAHVNLGDGLSAVEVGTAIHDRVRVSSTNETPLTGTITVERFATGDCTGAAVTAVFNPGPGAHDPNGGDYPSGVTVDLDPVLTFTPAVGVYSFRATYDGDGGEAIGTCEGPVHVVDASVAITPATAANEVSTNHDLTTTVSVQGGEIATGGATVTATKQSGPGTFVDPAPPGVCTTPAGASPQACDVTISSAIAGTTVVSSSASIPIDVDGDGAADITLTRSTGTTAQTGAASKTWVAVRISISPLTDANEIESSHTLTIFLEQSVEDGVWTPFGGQLVTASITNANGATAFFVVGPTCTTGTSGATNGKCIVVISSGTVGTTTVNANWAGGTVQGATVTAKDTDPDAAKTWVNVRISISPLTDANEVGTNHVLTILLEQSVADDTWTPLAGQCVLAGVVNDDGASATFVDTDPAADCDGQAPEGNSCVTAANGTCTVTISSPTAGSTTVEASWSGTAGGAVIGAKVTEPDAVKTWVAVRITITPAEDTNPVGTQHVLTITLEQSVADGIWTALAGECVTATLSDADGSTTSFVDTDAAADCNGDATEGNACVTGATGTCTVTITSPTAGTTTIEATWPGGTVAGAAITAKATDPDAIKHWVGGAAVLLIIDEDSLDNGIHYHPTGGGIVPSGPSFFLDSDVNDGISGHRQRSVLRFFAEHVGDTITVKTGQTGDEAWFAPNCIPQRWISGTSAACLPAGADRDTAIDNFFGLNGSAAIPAQSRLDKIPAVMPLRARGLVALDGQTVCAVVYDSDLSINYNRNTFPFTDGNLQGETLGIVAFRVDDVRRLNGFSSSTLPEVQLTILGADVCGAWSLLNAPVPRSSSVPNDIDPANLAGTGSNGYRQLLTFPALPPFH